MPRSKGKHATRYQIYLHIRSPTGSWSRIHYTYYLIRECRNAARRAGWNFEDCPIIVSGIIFAFFDSGNTVSCKKWGNSVSNGKGLMDDIMIISEANQ